MNSGIVGVPPVPMISLLASVTNSGRLSGVGYVGLAKSVHFSRQYRGWPRTFTIDVVSMSL